MIKEAIAKLVRSEDLSKPEMELSMEDIMTGQALPSQIASFLTAMRMKGGSAFVQAGGGVVADSDPAKEYQETVNKAKATIKAIEAAERGII